MEIIIILLTVIVVLEISRLSLAHRRITKKFHFKGKQEGTQRMIWDLEFKIHKTKEIKEEIRQEYDFMNARIATLETQIKDFPKDKDKNEKALLEDQKKRAERDRDRFENQMKALDLEINGAKPSKDYPDGVQGINSQVDSLRELVGMLKSWRKKL